ncbi:carbon-nitrogen hydrolase family protein [Halolamina rubra]|uniref:carbon-nitrogen hydrolase family protein n=1 Tax=Halolamina rubra TaxID=1380430 RepID=UPI0009E5BEA9|nr:carbon-nitrogen hydrolase family protein [Halolamina rubra]
MSQEITVRAVQRRPELGNVEYNVGIAKTAIEEAEADGVDLLVLPELFLSGYHIDEFDIAAIVGSAADAVDRLAAATSETTVVIGTPVELDGEYRNSAVVIDEGEVFGTYHKTHLYGDEESVFESGTSLPVFETTAGNLGVQVCYDIEFPEVSRQLTLAGAEVLVTPLANMRPFQSDQQIYGAARALENIRPHVVCNRIGKEQGVEFFGASAIYDERGQPVVSAGEDIPIELTGTIELTAEGADTLQYINDRRPTLYEN